MPQAAAFVLYGHSDFNALKGLSDELGRCFTEMGIQPVFINLLDWQQSLNDINQALRTYGPQYILGAFSFSGVGMELGEGSPNGNVWQYIKVPAVSWMMDHPAYHLKRHSISTPAVSRLYTTRDFIDFQRDYVKASGRTIHCRMGAFTHGREVKKREPRKGEVPLILFPKSLGNPEDRRQIWGRLPRNIVRVIEDSIDHYWGETKRWGSVVPSVLAAGHAAGLELQNDMPLFSFFIAQLDDYMRLLKANIVIKQLLPLPVKIYGKGIDHIDTSHAKASLHQPIDYHALQDEYHKALAVISMNPNNADDCHDRNYHAFGAGALPVSDINPWWEKTFPALQPYSYDFADRPVSLAVEKVFADPETAAAVAWDIGHQMREERPFQKAVEEALEWAWMQRYFEFNYASPLEGFVRSDLPIK